MEKEKYLKAIGKKIKTIRESKGLTQDDLGFECGCTKNAISRMESGGNNFTIKTLLKIAEALDVSVHDLLPKG